MSALFASVSARTAGFNSIDTGALTQESLALHYLLMFIGGGSAGTAGGVKVTTAAILLLLVVAEIRGRPDSEAFGRRVCLPAQRQAITVLVLGSVMVVAGTMVLLRGDGLAYRPRDLRGDLGLRHGRAFDRHHRRAAACRPTHA